jgi:hypothetical protein
MGTVYVFNVTNETLTMIVNGAPANEVAGWSFPSYQPSSVAVPRGNPQGSAAFANGENNVDFMWPDGNAPASISIDGNANPLQQDLLLFVTRNTWWLVNPYGAECGNGRVGRT